MDLIVNLHDLTNIFPLDLSMHLLHLLCAGFIKPTEGPSEKLVEKVDKEKKPARTSRVKEEKEQMKYQFHEVECISKIAYN